MRIPWSHIHLRDTELQQVLDEVKAEVRLDLGLADHEGLGEQAWELVRILAFHKYQLRMDARPVHQLRDSLFFAFTLVVVIYCSWYTARGELDWTYMLMALIMPVAYGIKLAATLKAPLFLMLWDAEGKERALAREIETHRARLAPKPKGRPPQSGLLDGVLRDNPEAVAEAFRAIATDSRKSPSHENVADRLGVSDDTLRRARERHNIPWPPSPWPPDRNTP